MKKLYFLALLCCIGITALAQTTVTIWASGPAGSFKTGFSDGTNRFDGDMTVTSNTSRGYAVFNLGRIPAGATIMSVTAGIDVNAYLQPGPGPYLDFTWNTYGYVGDLSGTTVPATLFAQMVPPLATSTPWNSVSGAYGPPPSLPYDPVFTSGPAAMTFVSTNIGGTISLAYNTGPATNVIYNITGETGDTTTFGAGHAPFITVTYCAKPTATAVAAPNPVCFGTSLTLTGSATNATDYTWNGPNGFTSTMLSPAFTVTTTATAGTYTLTVANVCGAVTNSATATTTVSVIPGPITGITNVWVDFTTDLADPTPGGRWTSSNSTLATVGSSSGTVYGVRPGNVTITYTTPTGCTFTAGVLVVESVFSEIPVVDASSIGLGFPIVSWWPFCGDTLDHHNYPLVGGTDLLNYSVAMSSTLNTTPAVLTTDRFGLPDNAYEYNGKTSMMQLTTFFPISGPTGDYTYSVWFMADTIQSSVILYNGNIGGYSSLTPPYSYSDGWGFVINDGSSYLLPPDPSGVPTIYNPGAGAVVSVLFGGVGQYLSTPITLNRWHNLMLKKNGGSYNFYVDNVSAGFFIATFNPMSALTNGVFRVGMDSTGQKAFRGKIDDISIYNRQLNTAERDSLYNFNPDARVFTLGNDTTICGDSITLSAKPPTIGNDYVWSTGATDSFITVNPAAGITGNIYGLNVGKPYGCQTKDDITVYKAPIPVNVGLPSLNICLGDTVTLTDFYPRASFTWSTGDTIHAIRVATSGTYTVAVDSFRYYTHTVAGVTVTDTITCIGRDTVNVFVHPVPIIGLPATIAHCDGTPVTIVPRYDTAYKYLWSTTGDPGFSVADSITDTALFTHVYWVAVTDTVTIGGPVFGGTSVGCTKSDTVSVLIVFDTVTFLGRDTAICLGRIWPPGGEALATNNFIANYQWTPTTGIINSNTYAPVIGTTVSAEYFLTVSYPGCPNIVDSFHLDIQPPPSVSLGEPRDVCQFDTLHLIANVTPSWYTHYSYNWTPGGRLDSTNTPNVIFYADTSIDTVLLYVTVGTPMGLINRDDSNCIVKDSALIYVHPGLFDSSMSDTILCPGDSVQLHALINVHGDSLNTAFSSYQWIPSMYLSDSTSSSPWVHPITTVNYTFVGTSTFGCKDTTKVSVVVKPAAVIYLGDSVTLYPGESYQISPQTNCVNFSWYPPLGLSNTGVSNPVATPEVNTKYIVHASTEDGCVITDSISIHVDPGTYIQIPNAFTPGGSVNNRFFVFKRGISSLVYFRIFDRWGNKVFETTNIENGWDGMYNGKPQPFGVYIYEVEAVADNGKVYDKVGNVTLIR